MGTIHKTLAELESQYAALGNLPHHIKNSEEVMKSRESLHRQIAAHRSLVDAQPHDQSMFPIPPRPEPLPPPAHGTERTAKEVYDNLMLRNPLQAAQFAAKYGTDIFGK